MFLGFFDIREKNLGTFLSLNTNFSDFSAKTKVGKNVDLQRLLLFVSLGRRGTEYTC